MSNHDRPKVMPRMERVLSVRRGTPSSTQRIPAAPGELSREQKLQQLRSAHVSQVALYADEVAERIAKLEVHAVRLAQRFGIPSAAFALDFVQESTPLVPGNSVEHAQYGPGQVMDVLGEGENAKITVQFFAPGVGIKRIIRRFLRNASDTAIDAEFPPARAALGSETEDALSVQMMAEWLSKALASTISHSLQERELVILERKDGRWGLFYHRQSPALGPHTGRDTVVPLKDAPLDVRQRFLERSEEFFRIYVGSCQGRIERMKAAIDQADLTLAFLEDSEID